MLPPELSRQELVSADDPYITATKYVIEYDIANGSNSLSLLPLGLRRLLWIVNLDSAWNNGGFAGYFGNRTDDDDKISEEVFQVPLALELMGAAKLSEVVTRAIVCWKSLLVDDDDVSISIDINRRKKWFEKMHRELDSFDQQFNEVYDQSLKALSAYIRAHPDEFAHSS